MEGMTVMSLDEEQVVNIWKGAEKRGADRERERILALLDKELAYLEDGDYWKEDEFLRNSAKALRQFRGQITGENQE